MDLSPVSGDNLWNKMCVSLYNLKRLQEFDFDVVIYRMRIEPI